MNLIILADDEIGDSGLACLTGARALHLLTVLHVAAGDSVRIGRLDGPQGVGLVEAVDGGPGAGNGGGAPAVTLRCHFESEVEARPPVDLLLALPRPKVMRRLWAQLAALGVDRIIVTNAARVERHYFDTHVLAPATYTPLLIEGLQQARATRLPRVSIHRRFRVLIEDEITALSDAGTRLFAEPLAPAISTADEGSRVLLAVGPEGGWNDFECGLLAAHGFAACGIGARTLRTDTACIALLAIVTDRLR